MAIPRMEGTRRRFAVEHPASLGRGVRTLAVVSGAVFLPLLVDAAVRDRAFFDLWLLRAVQGIEVAGLRPLLGAANALTGSVGAIAVWGLALAAVLTARWWGAAAGLLAIPFGVLVNRAVGTYVADRERPGVTLELERVAAGTVERSFPSGHVQGAVLLYGLLFVAAGRIPHRALRLTARAGSAVVLATVGFVRVWHGAHWPSDALGAYALGGLVLAGLLGLMARVDAGSAVPRVVDAVWARARQGPGLKRSPPGPGGHHPA